MGFIHQIGKFIGNKFRNSSAYASAKAGLIQLTKWLSSTLAPNIRVNSISLEGYLEINQKICKSL